MSTSLLKLHALSGHGDDFDLSVASTAVDHGTSHPVGARVEVVLRNHAERLIELIEESSNMDIFCAVAWFTNFEILDALARARSRGVKIAIVVQKEDFLRPETAEGDIVVGYNKVLRKKYDSLGLLEDTPIFDEDNLLNRFCKIYESRDAEWCSDLANEKASHASISAVRCVGNHNSDNAPSFPRMHNKFCVFIRDTQSVVWTGSYNFSFAATQSLENAVVIYSDEVADIYFKEFATLFLISERLDWTSRWACSTLHYHT